MGVRVSECESECEDESEDEGEMGVRVSESEGT